jgi:hypothetical protein
MNFFNFFKRAHEYVGRVTPSHNGRMSIVGKNIYDQNGTFFVPVGFNQGHGELTTAGDPAEDVSMGANTVRIIWRVWGPYDHDGHGTTRDGLQIGAPGNFIADYLEGIVTRIEQAKAAGLKVQLAGDSNCGQSGNQGMPGDTSTYTYCTISGVPGTNFFTPEGAAMRAAYYVCWRWLARRCFGMVDFYEPLVEPSAPTATQDSTWALQNELRQIILQEDPHALFVIGGYPAYFVSAINGAFHPSWAGDNRTILTCDMLNNVVIDRTGFPSKLASCTSARTTYNCPVMINQIGSNSSDDPDDTLLGGTLTDLMSASGGSIGYTIWEKVSVSTGSFGMYTQTVVGGTRTPKPNRKTVITDCFNQTKIAAT